MKETAGMSKALPTTAPMCNGAALRQATRKLSLLYDDILQPCGLRLSQHSVLVHIQRAGMPSMTQLARGMGLDRSALSHNLKPLERDGWVSLCKDSLDKRSTRVALTPSGQRKLAQSKALWAVAQQRFEGAFGAAKAQAMRELLLEISSEQFSEKFANALPVEQAPGGMQAAHKKAS